jgi:hypothetical protein
MSKELFIYNPVWPECPPICKSTHLPAFNTMKELDEFLNKNGPSCPVIKKFQCNRCDSWHAQTSAADPAGQTSGTTRSGKMSDELKEKQANKYKKFFKL